MSEEELQAKMALLPDYGDEPFPRRASGLDFSASALGSSLGSGGGRAEARLEGARQDEPGVSARGRERGLGPDAAGEDAVAAPASVVAAGCLGGMVGNAALGLVLLGVQRAGVTLYGPGVLAVVVALIVLGLLAGSWPRRVWLSAGGFLVGLVLSFGVLLLFVRPALDAATGTRAAPAVLQDDTSAPSGATDGSQPS